MLKKAAFVIAFALLGLPGSALAFGGYPAAPSFVYEYFNTVTGHYFYTLDSIEIANVDAGRAGPGWVKTGLVLSAYQSPAVSSYYSGYPTCDKLANPCVEISRFYAPGPNSHFLTGSTLERAILEQPNTGWTLERVDAFYAPMPDPSTGTCAGYTPVRRFYNNRWMFNDSGHRYTTSEDVASRMRAAGWIDEGVVFCSYGYGAVGIASYEVDVSASGGVMDRAACDAPTAIPRPCIALTNLPIPDVVYPAAPPGSDQADAFSAKTRVWSLGNAQISGNVAYGAASRDAAADDVFVQLTSSWKNVFGLHLITTSKGPSQFTTMAPMMRLPEATEPDARLFPFISRYETSYELNLHFPVTLATLSNDPGGATLGVVTIEYQDSVSGRLLRANVLAYGSAAPAEFAARDAVDGVVFVATSFRQGSPYGRAIGGTTAHSKLPDGDTYSWVVNRSEFLATIQAARTVDPDLSADPAGYFVRSFGVKNEIYGTGEMSLVIYDLQFELRPLNDQWVNIGRD